MVIDVDEVIDMFASKHPRRRILRNIIGNLVDINKECHKPIDILLIIDINWKLVIDINWKPPNENPGYAPGFLLFMNFCALLQVQYLKSKSKQAH